MAETNETLYAIEIDPDVCVGVGRCEELAPDAVNYDEDTGTATVKPGALVTRELADELVIECPSGAISIVEREGDG